MLVDKLMAAFPRHDWSDTAVALYARCIQPLETELGGHAVERAVMTLDLAPTVRWLIDTARAEAIRLGVNQPHMDADEPVAANPEVVSKIKQMYLDAFAKIDERVPKSARGDGGHWHGGPNPCPVCGGMAPAWLRGSK